MTAGERLKARFADVIERLCIVEEQLEQALAENAALKEQLDEQDAAEEIRAAS